MTGTGLTDSYWPAHDELPLLAGSIGTLLRERAADQGDRVALLWPDGERIGRMSYADLRDRAERTARSLLRAAAPGHRVAVWSRNSLDWVVLQYACALAGLVLTPFNPAWTDRELEHAIALTAPSLIFSGLDGRGVDLHDRACALDSPAPTLRLHELGTLADDDGPLPEVGAEAPFLIQFTSGTTGRAKGALLSHRAALHSGYFRARNGHAGPHDVWLNPVPLHHVGGSCVMVLGALSVGGAYVVMDRFDVDALVGLLRPTGATRIGGVPTMLYALLDHPRIAEAAGGVVGVGLGGASVPPALVDRVRIELAAVPSIGYGQSECPLITSTDADDDAMTIAMTVGRPVPHTTVKIVHVGSGEVVPVGTIGEVCVRSPVMMDGYVAMPAATADVLDPEGFLHTGDLGSMDTAGVITIHGRAREVIIRKGENIYPIEVEDALLRHQAVAAAAVLGVLDERDGQTVAAAVQLAPGSTATAEELEAFVATRIAHYKVPRIWCLVEHLPLTASGKVRKLDLADLFDGPGVRPHD
ncbi:AMP-dependent synthetase and ligase [Parafrankia sp. EAN1pec]|uniref:class I adenylate-forming enzyme family protein n=1 Tax=Parafrankia sp. (strain EAN1pec) TaxID=298653 RepID=UPI0000542F96|nr:AMP-dependent synthetase and ligase [Frankia sp. EAN1pec]